MALQFPNQALNLATILRSHWVPACPPDGSGVRPSAGDDIESVEDSEFPTIPVITSASEAIQMVRGGDLVSEMQRQMMSYALGNPEPPFLDWIASLTLAMTE